MKWIERRQVQSAIRCPWQVIRKENYYEMD